MARSVVKHDNKTGRNARLNREKPNLLSTTQSTLLERNRKVDYRKYIDVSETILQNQKKLSPIVLLQWDMATFSIVSSFSFSSALFRTIAFHRKDFSSSTRMPSLDWVLYYWAFTAPYSISAIRYAVQKREIPRTWVATGWSSSYPSTVRGGIMKGLWDGELAFWNCTLYGKGTFFFILHDDLLYSFQLSFSVSRFNCLADDSMWFYLTL